MTTRALVFWSALVVALPLPAAAEGPVLSGSETRITTNGSDQYDPSISGNLVVYTDDREDDIHRVLRALRTELRVRQVLSYKTNAATAANEYGPGAAKYVSPAGSLDMELRRT